MEPTLFQHSCYLILAPINVIFTCNVISVYECFRCQQLLQHIHQTNALVLEHCTMYIEISYEEYKIIQF